MQIGTTLALIAASGIILGACGGNDAPANTPASVDPAAAGAKTSCGAGHTDDKTHCSAMAAPDAGK